MALNRAYYSRYFGEVLFMGAPLVAASTLLTFERTTESKAYFAILVVLVTDYVSTWELRDRVGTYATDCVRR